MAHLLFELLGSSFVLEGPLNLGQPQRAVCTCVRERACLC